MTAPETHALAVERTAHVVVMGAADAPRALVALHGYGQRAEIFARHLAPHAGPERRVVVPEALSRFYLEVPTPDVVQRGPLRRRVGASWMTREHREAEIADTLGYLDRAAAAFLPPGAPIDALGFSQGAAVLCRWAVRGSAPLARLVLWGSLVPDDVLAAPETLRRLPPVVLVVGDADGYLAPDAVEAHAARLVGLGVSATHRTFAGGHRMDAGTLAAVLGV